MENEDYNFNIESKANIEIILMNNTPIQTGMTIPVFSDRVFNVYEVPLDFLKFNPYNDRIASYIKSYEFKNKNNIINWFSEEGQKLISEFLWESDEINNKKTEEDIKRNRQHTFAIINKNGLVIDGNRRLCILKKICAEIDYRFFNINFFDKLKTIILNDSCSKTEIMRLETAIQMGQDEKLVYQPIEKYLKVNKLLQNDFTEKEIASLMKKKVKDIKNYKKIFALMENYLDYINVPNQFQFIKKFEDHFINLNSTLEAMKNNKYRTDWKYDANDIYDFQMIGFYFIRSGYEGKNFRKLLLGTPNSKSKGTLKKSLFANEKTWNEFYEKIRTINDRAEKILNQRKDLKNKEEWELIYQEETHKDFERYLEMETNILQVTSKRFKGEDLMRSAYEYINQINEIFEETNITPNFKKNFKKIKELICEIDKKFLKKENKDD